jgi:hypothetical protein
MSAQCIRLAKRFLAVVRVFQASWVIYKTWHLRQCFDWHESYETICILSFMVCSMHGDQLSTVLVLLYATSQHSTHFHFHPPPPTPPAPGDAVSPMAGRINCCVQLRSQCEVTLLWRTLALYLLQHCVFTSPAHIRTRTEKRFPARCQISFQTFLANNEWKANTRTPWRASLVKTL